MKRIKIFVLIFIAVFVLVPSFSVQGAKEGNRKRPFRILCISSYNFSYSIVPEQLQGIRDGLGDLSYDIDYEFLDSKNYYKTKDLEKISEYMAYKIHQSDPFDLLILCDDNALHFWKNDRQGLFANVPVVFMGINNVSAAKEAADSSLVTGIVEETDYIASLKLMHKLFPDRHNVIAMVDSSVTGKGEYALFREKTALYPEFNYSYVITQDYSKIGLADNLRKLGRDDIILYLDFLVDGDGNLYTEQSATTFVSENVGNVPIFRVSSVNLGIGILGGVVYSHYDAGVCAGQMAAKILNGTKPKDIELVTKPFNTLVFDQDVMDEFGIKDTMLPPETKIINPHWSLRYFYRENKVISHLIILVTILLIAMIIILWHAFQHRDKMVNQDFLTKMPNRYCINDRINTAIERRDPFGIMMLDVDYFKTINDTLGHQAGDELLVEVGKRLKALSGPGLLFARIGGDEFNGLFTGNRIEEGEAICKKVMETLRKEYKLSCGTVNITTSIGFASYPLNTNDPAKVMNYADAALYEVKERGRNGYQIFHEGLLKNLKKKE